MLYEVMRYIRNFFPCGVGEREVYTIESGGIDLPFLLYNQYYLIEGSVFNDGVHKYPETDLIDETFWGVITPLAIPQSFLELVEEIKSYQEKHGEASPFTSESFGGYSYTKGSGTNGKLFTWKDAFGTRLNAFRKI